MVISETISKLLKHTENSKPQVKCHIFTYLSHLGQMLGDYNLGENYKLCHFQVSWIRCEWFPETADGTEVEFSRAVKLSLLGP